MTTSYETVQGEILLVDDNPNNLKLLAKILTDQGYRIRASDSGRYALKSIKDAPPDVILLDVKMPGMDGYEVCRRLQADPVAKNIPVIFVSALKEEESKVKGFEAGGVDYITKPFQTEEILARVRSHISLSRMQHHLEDIVKERTSELEKEIAVRRKAEEALRKSEERYRSLVDNIGIGVALISPSMEILALNRQMKEWFPSVDISKRQVCYQSFNVPSKNDVCSYCPTIKTLKDGQRHVSITEIPAGDTIRNYRVISSPIKDKDGFVVSAIEILEDITEQLQAEKEKQQMETQLHQAQKMEAIGTLAGGIAHDFNNILTPILGFTEMARDKLPPESPIASNLDQVYKAGNRAKELAKQILAFSRQSDEELRPIQIHLIIKEALKLLRSSIPTTIEIRQDIDSRSGTVFSDPTRIHQIIMNLCTNAYQAMLETGGVLAVTVRPIELEDDDHKIKNFSLTPGPYVELTVSDSGIGMDRKTIDKIYDPYFTTKANGEGTGLGLSVVHGIVKSYGGHISVYSEPGKGTTFRLYLPRITTDITTKEIETPAIYPTSNERALIVDDEEIIVDTAKAMLSSLGYRVTAMTSSRAALRTFQKDPDDFDFIITDMTMPNMNGVEFIQRIRQIRPGIPIILCTGFSELIDKDRASRLGIQKYLMKPVVMRELAESVREVLGKSAS